MNPLRFLRKPKVVVRDITPEERHQIYLEEKARIEAPKSNLGSVKQVLLLVAIVASGFVGYVIGYQNAIDWYTAQVKLMISRSRVYL